MRRLSMLGVALTLAVFTACCAGKSGGSDGGSGTSGATTSGGTSGGSSGSSCVGAGSPCGINANCCANFTCDPTSNSCQPLQKDAGCSPSKLGGACVTAADCPRGDVCQSSVCATAPLPSLTACLSGGAACSTDGGAAACCAGPCKGGVCPSLTPCGQQGESCGASAGCCNGLSCAPGADGGAAACAPACGAHFANCATDADCCAAQGLTCTQSLCLAATDFQGPTYCASGQCSSSPECVLGSACQVKSSSTGTVDPCAAAGYVCDAQTSVCVEPTEGQGCLPGGPACQSIADSTLQTQCLTVQLYAQAGPLCTQLCDTSADCVNPGNVCVDNGVGADGKHYKVCAQNLSGGRGCSDYFGTCAASTATDGLCLPYTFPGQQGGLFGFCIEGANDGGTTGDPCLLNGNRQIGGLCNPQNFCWGGVCSPTCNAGTSDAGPNCGPQVTADGGVGAAQVCFPAQGQSSDPVDFGSCSVACDFTSSTGGGCVTSSDGIPEKCFPDLFYTGADQPTGLCVVGDSSPIAIGQPCNGPVPTGLLDPCAAGSMCLGTIGANNNVCVQLCTNVGQTGGPCPTGQSCLTIATAGANGAVVNSVHTGYCGTPTDGGA